MHNYALTILDEVIPMKSLRNKAFGVVPAPVFETAAMLILALVAAYFG
jgi:hypothetical protein